LNRLQNPTVKDGRNTIFYYVLESSEKLGILSVAWVSNVLSLRNIKRI
jgi:hypothetical protein